MIDAKRGEERIMRVTEIDSERTSWVDEGRAGALRGLRQLGGAMDDLYPPDYCPVVRKCTRQGDWCCWGAGKGESDER